MNMIDQWEAEAKLLEPHHEYRDAEPSLSGKRGVRCILCNHYTNGMERGKFSLCPKHTSFRMKALIDLVRKKDEALKQCYASTSVLKAIESQNDYYNGVAHRLGGFVHALEEAAKNALALTEDLK